MHGAVTDPRFTPVHPRAEIHSALSVPLMTGGRLVGVLNLNATKRPRAFTVGDLKAVSILTNIAASALIMTQLYPQLQEDIAARTRAETEVRRLNAEMSSAFRDRTASLEVANRELETFSYSVSHNLGRVEQRPKTRLTTCYRMTFRKKLDPPSCRPTAGFG